jgi:hypothetical protein
LKIAVELRERRAHHFAMRRAFFYFSLAALFLLAGCQQSNSESKNDCNRKPRSWWRTPHQGLSVMRSAETVYLERGGMIFWNEAHVTDVQIEKLLKESSALAPQPFIILAADKDAPCPQLNLLRDMIESNSGELDCKKDGFCGEGINWNQCIGDVVFTDPKSNQPILPQPYQCHRSDIPHTKDGKINR